MDNVNNKPIQNLISIEFDFHEKFKSDFNEDSKSWWMKKDTKAYESCQKAYSNYEKMPKENKKGSIKAYKKLEKDQYRQLGKEFSGILGKISHIFIWAITFSKVNLYEYRGKLVFKKFRTSVSSPIHPRKNSPKEIHPKTLSVNKEKTHKYNQLEKEFDKLINPNSRIFTASELPQPVLNFCKNNKTEYDNLKIIFTHYYFGKSEIEDWEQGARHFSYFVHFHIWNQYYKLPTDSKALALALRFYHFDHPGRPLSLQLNEKGKEQEDNVFKAYYRKQSDLNNVLLNIEKVVHQEIHLPFLDEKNHKEALIILEETAQKIDREDLFKEQNRFKKTLFDHKPKLKNSENPWKPKFAELKKLQEKLRDLNKKKLEWMDPKLKNNMDTKNLQESINRIILEISKTEKEFQELNNQIGCASLINRFDFDQLEDEPKIDNPFKKSLLGEIPPKADYFRLINKIFTFLKVQLPEIKESLEKIEVLLNKHHSYLFDILDKQKETLKKDLIWGSIIEYVVEAIIEIAESATEKKGINKIIKILINNAINQQMNVVKLAQKIMNEKTIHEIEDQIDELKILNEELTKQNNQNKKNTGELKKQVDENFNKIVLFKKQIIEIKKQTAHDPNKIDELNTQITELEKQIKENEKLKNELKNQITEINNKIIENTNQITALTKQYDKNVEEFIKKEKIDKSKFTSTKNLNDSLKEKIKFCNKGNTGIISYVKIVAARALKGVVKGVFAFVGSNNFITNKLKSGGINLALYFTKTKLEEKVEALLYDLPAFLSIIFDGILPNLGNHSRLKIYIDRIIKDVIDPVINSNVNTKEEQTEMILNILAMGIEILRDAEKITDKILDPVEGVFVSQKIEPIIISNNK